MLGGFDKYSTTVRVQIVRPMGDEDLEPRTLMLLIDGAIEEALKKEFPGTAVLVSVDTPDMKWLEAD